ncbi:MULTISPECIES: hypothetical protein [unclassified Micromonospora]|uniref:hypothetical protein n=1 Tax=unclassified Micromonospora TaxID=2617518 RepID=UPI00249131C3|nr:hypothetical protein [Micromonospora sp. AKA38]
MTPRTAQRLKTTGRGCLWVAAATGLMLGAAVPPAHASAGSIPPSCRIAHALYVQPVATVVAEVATPEDASCGVGSVSLNVWRNGVLVAAISGGPTLVYTYHCVTTAPTEWRTNFDSARIFNCG